MRMSEETGICRNCRQPLGESGRCEHCDHDAHIWTIWDWRPLLSLAMVIALGFSFTSLVVGSFHEKEKALALEYYEQGSRALEAKQGARAVEDLETALVYSHHDFQYQLKLVDALLEAGATSEAQAQLRSFWEQHPHDAQVNLKLARLEVHGKHVDEAIRYYQNAIEGEWPEKADPLRQRIDTRFETAEYLMQQGRKEKAESTLMELASVLPSASPDQGRLAALFLSNGDSTRALSIYLMQLSLNRNDSAAALGAANANLAAGNYTVARHYVEDLKPETAESRALREVLERMEALDPFARGASERVSTERTMAAFRIALERLAGCGVPFAQELTQSATSAVAVDPAPWSGFAKWAGQLTPYMSERKLRGSDDVIESMMRFAFQAERAAQKNCGAQTLNDRALLLLAHERLGAEQ